ncbi:hypothetical protein EON65_47810 [archaeon]|nr:MAG: hypothetical protein EON65_47810 [archaeon]
MFISEEKERGERKTAPLTGRSRLEIEMQWQEKSDSEDMRVHSNKNTYHMLLILAHHTKLRQP